MQVTVQLTVQEIEAIAAQLKEGGGFQSLFRRLQANVKGSTLTIDVDTAKRAIRYARSYGQGGWEDTLASIANKLQAALGETPTK